MDDLYGDYWQDWAPNEYEPDDVGEDTGGEDTGFGSITDPANDAYIPGGQTGISNRQYLDIREISYAFDDNGLTLTMELQGTVSDDVTSVSYTHLTLPTN